MIETARPPVRQNSMVLAGLLDACLCGAKDAFRSMLVSHILVILCDPLMREQLVPELRTDAQMDLPVDSACGHEASP